MLDVRAISVHYGRGVVDCGVCVAPQTCGGGGTANSVETDSENGATYEVEVTKPDGRTVDVRLDESYAVVVIEADGESR